MSEAPRPRRPLPRLRRRPRFEGLSFNRMIPNIMTMFGLCAGLVAIRFAIDARWPQAATFIVVAGVIDGLDGRLARLLKATTRFGAEFDSLADFLSFGVAPAIHRLTRFKEASALFAPRAVPAITRPIPDDLLRFFVPLSSDMLALLFS
jgi:hypothetical protein